MNEVEVDKILAYVDDDDNGYITFSEFLVACVGTEDCLTKQNLSVCFKLLDKDASGSISISEMKMVFCKEAQITDGDWLKLLKTVDDDGNSEINLEEFSQLMRNIFSVKVYDV